MASNYNINLTDDNSSPPNGLCEVCKGMFSCAIDGLSGQHHTTLQSFKLSRRDCYICRYLWTDLSSACSDTIDSIVELSITFQIHRSLNTGCVELRFRVLGDDIIREEYHTPRFLLFAQISVADSTSNSTGPETLVINSDIGESTSHSLTERLISAWLKTCNPQDHPYCHRSKFSPSQLPTRLLDVQEPGRVRLVPSSARHKPVIYVTLSHCWGTLKVINLSKVTSSQLLSGFDEGMLPRSFMDAVTITRSLGIRYLWIDSLCIYQDDDLDWTKESRRMAEVYSGAYCNIAATAAGNASEGCFCSSDRWMARAHAVEATWTSSQAADIIHPENYLICAADFWDRAIAKQPLTRRAWVIQERILAKRTIHFSRPQVFWECSEMIACETFPKKIPIGSPRFDMSMIWKAPPSRLPKKMALPGDDQKRPRVATWMSYHLDGQPIDRWQAIIEVYNTCLLTEEQDKLPAIAGIAKTLGQEEQRGRYVAGIWEGNFFRQMLWWIFDTSDKVNVPKQYRAPSWSWAAVDGKIFHHTIFDDVKVKNLKLIAIDELQVEQDSLFLPDVRWYAHIEGPLHLATTTPQEKDPFSLCRLEFQNSQGIGVYLYWNSGIGRYPDPRPIYVLPLFHPKYDDEASFGDICGLALIETRSAIGEFQRVGLFVSAGEELADVRFVLQAASELPERSYESKRTITLGDDVQHLYTFSLV